MKVIYDAKVPVKSGNTEVGVWLAVPKPFGTGAAVAVIEILGLNGARLASRIVRRVDVSNESKQKFGLIITRSRNQRVHVRVKAVDVVKLLSVLTKASVLPTNVICPLLGSWDSLKQWYCVSRPRRYMYCHIDPTFSSFVDETGTPVYYRIQHALWNIGRVCGLGFIPSNQSRAHIVFHQAPPRRIEALSIQFGNAMQWFGTNQYGSIYIAKHPNNKDIWIGRQLKDGGKASSINISRFTSNSFLQAKHGLDYHYYNASICAATNANFSGPILYSRGNQNCLAGFDYYEQQLLRNAYGPNWLGRWNT